MTGLDKEKFVMQFESYEEKRCYIDSNLDNPNDPFGLADVDEDILKYLAPMNCGELERAELCRRFRLTRIKNTLENL